MTAYCIDTSSLVQAWVRAYPIRYFEPLWDKIDELIKDGRLFSSIEVLNELEKRDDDLFAWAKERKEMFRELDDETGQDKMAHLMGMYPRLVDTRKGKSMADPFVIAVAAVADPPHTVVTEEAGTGKLEKPKIPDVCIAEGLETMKFLDLIIQEDWRF